MRIQIARNHQLNPPGRPPPSPLHSGLHVQKSAVPVSGRPSFMKLLIVRHKPAQWSESVILLQRHRPFVVEIICNASRGIVLQAFESTRVICIHDRVVNQIPTSQMRANNRPNLRSNPPVFPVQRIDTELKIEPIEELVLARMRPHEQFANLNPLIVAPWFVE